MVRIVTIIPTHNRRDCLQEVLSDLSAQYSCSVSAEHQIVVVVDGSQDGTLEMLHLDFPEATVVRGPGDWWYTRSMNEGFRQALKSHPDLILTLNDDVRLPPDYLKNILSEYQSTDGDSIIGSVSISCSKPHRITFAGVKRIIWWRYKQKNHNLQGRSDRHLLQIPMRPSVVLPGRGMLIPESVLRKLNLFDEQLPQYGSDDDFCLRASRLGIPIYISYKAQVFSKDALTAIGNPARKSGLWAFSASFFNKYSPRYLPKTCTMIIRHGHVLLLPLTLFIVILGSFKAYFKKRLWSF